MYLESVHIQYLKLLEDFQLSFRREDGTLRHWTVIIGRNGTAKTSLLQAVALAASGQLQVNSLAKPVVAHLRDRRKGTAKMRVEASLSIDDPGGRCLRSEVMLAPSSTTLRASAHYVDAEGKALDEAGPDPLVEARAENRPGWFVAGYGVSRFLPDPTKRPRLENPAIERMEPLFDQYGGLTSLRFVDHFDKAAARRFVRLLRDVLTNVAALVPDLEDIELRGAGGVHSTNQLIDHDRFTLKVGKRRSKLPAVALSHGYQSTIAWIADLVGHIMLDAGRDVPAKEMTGLVLIDEIDLYLHPAWQAGLVPALRQTFPSMQFIATTHSPVLLSGLAPDEVVRVAPDPQTGSVKRWGHSAETGELIEVSPHGPATVEPDPRTMTGTELYRSWFGVDRLVLHPLGEKLREYLRLATDPFRTDEEDVTLRDLGRELASKGVERLATPVAREALDGEL